MELTKEIAVKVKETVECGLSKGLGKPNPGEMCIEAAVCYAYGLPHSDNPPCVGSAVRSFKIRLNDANWSSNEARAKGMIEISIAQLNSNEIDQKEFAKRVTIKTINVIIADLAHRYSIELESKLRIVVDLEEARQLCLDLKRYAAVYAAADAAAAYAAAYAAAAYAAADAAYAAAAADAAYAAAYAAAAADATYAAAKDNILIKAANICLEVLKELKSPGCQFLYLLDKVVN
jgi:hypothetical protein